MSGRLRGRRRLSLLALLLGVQQGRVPRRHCEYPLAAGPPRVAPSARGPWALRACLQRERSIAGNELCFLSTDGC